MKEAKDLTREETIKALRNCSTAGESCKLCPLHDFVRPGLRCFDDLMAHAAEILETALSVQYE